MRIRQVLATRGYDLFKAAVTLILLLIVLTAVAVNNGSTQAAEPEPSKTSTPTPALEVAPMIEDVGVVDGCIESSGTGSPKSQLQVRSDDSILGTVDVGSDGTWSITTCVSPGNYRLAAVSINESGMETTRSASLVVLVPEPTAVPTPIPVETEESEPAPPATDTASEGQDYIVEPGDWLMGLARAFYGDAGRWEDIYNATNAKAAVDSSYASIEDPNALIPGWKIWIPLP